eukprot:5183397-Pyramimonas_sp.AAC.1
MYNESGNDPLVRTRNDRLFRFAFEDAEALGDQPVVMCVDSNTTVAQTSTLSAALATGRWHDVGAMYGAQPTYGLDPKWDKYSAGNHITRPDLILVSTSARDSIHSFRLRRDLGIKCHLGLELTLNITKLSE